MLRRMNHIAEPYESEGSILSIKRTTLNRVIHEVEPRVCIIILLWNNMIHTIEHEFKLLIDNIEPSD